MLESGCIEKFTAYTTRATIQRHSGTMLSIFGIFSTTLPLPFSIPRQSHVIESLMVNKIQVLKSVFPQHQT